MFACDPHPDVFTVESVQIVEVSEDDSTHLFAGECGSRLLCGQMRIDSAKNPWRAMRAAADHYSVGASEIKYVARFSRLIDITIRKNRNGHGRFDRANRLVLRGTCIKILARTTVHSECLNAGSLRDLRNAHAVAGLSVPSGADLERYGHIDCSDCGVEQSRDGGVTWVKFFEMNLERVK